MTAFCRINTKRKLMPPHEFFDIVSSRLVFMNQHTIHTLESFNISTTTFTSNCKTIFNYSLIKRTYRKNNPYRSLYSKIRAKPASGLFFFHFFHCYIQSPHINPPVAHLIDNHFLAVFIQPAVGETQKSMGMSAENNIDIFTFLG